MRSLMRPARALVAALALSGLAACGGGGTDSNTPSPTVPPTQGAVTGFSAVGSSATTVSLAWRPDPQAGPLAIERRTGTADPVRIAIVNGSTGAYVDSGLAPSTAYDYRLVTLTPGTAPLASARATTGDEAALATGAGLPIGVPAVTTLTAAAHQANSPDGQIRLTLPAGAVAPGTELTTQAVQNTAPDGLGQALRVRLSAVPIQAATVQVRYDEADTVLADGLRIAVQRGDGTWLSLPLTALDKTTRTLTASLPLELLAPAQAELAASVTRPHGPGDVSLDFTVVKYLAVRLMPRQASVPVDGTLRLVPFARVRGYDVTISVCEDIDETREACIITPIVEVREVPLLNTKAGYTRGWHVFLSPGGDATYGTVASTGNVGATYTAPHQVPDPRTVTVTFQSTHQRTGRTVVLASAVTITDGSWAGTLSSVDGPSIAGTTVMVNGNVSWRLDPEASTAATLVYRPLGTLTVTITDDNCTAHVTPATAPVTTNPLFGALEIDVGTTPQRYRLRLVTFWDATITGSCPEGSATLPTLAGYGWEGEGVLEGNTFSASFMQEQAQVGWRFDR